MKKLLVLAILLGASLTPLTFAQEDDTSTPSTTKRETIKMNQEEIRENWKEFHETFGYAGIYLKKDLTTEEKTAAKEVIVMKKNEIQTLNQEIRTKIKNKETIDREAYRIQYEEIYTSFKTNFLPYVDEAKVEEFTTFIEQKIATIETNRGLRKENHQIRKEIRTEKKQLRTTVRVGKKAEGLRRIVEKIDNTVVLNGLSTKITELLIKTTNEEMKTFLNDINLLIQDKLGLLNVDEEGNVVEETTE